RCVHDLATYDYAIVRVVPKVERAEFVNAGVIVSCPTRDLLLARIELDEQRLVAIPTICAGGEHAGPIGRLSQRERFHWLVAPRSTIIQTSPTHTCSARDLEAVVERLLQTMVRPPAGRNAGRT